MPENPDGLRQRAAMLRRRAAAVETCSAFVLPQRSGDDVWMGPTAGRFRDELGIVLVKLRAARSELLHAATGLEVRAELIESSQSLGRPF